MSTMGDTCSRVQALLEAYFEETLPNSQAAMVEAHLEACTVCSYELLQIEKVAAALAAVPHSEPAVDLVRRISAQVAILPKPVSSRRLLAGWRRIEVLAAASVVFLAVWRYVFPLLLSRESERLPILGWLTHFVAALGHREIIALWVHDLWLSCQGVTEALRLAAIKIAPVIGLYAVAEIGIIAAVVLLSHRSRRAHPASLTTLL